MAKGGIVITEDTLTPRLREFQPKLYAAIAATIDRGARQATAYAKANASWTDQTGNARNSLNAQAFTSGEQFVIVVYHQMPYGVWLEVRHSGTYAIILPTIQAVGPQVMATLRAVMGRMM